jgi:hypothetical protein
MSTPTKSMTVRQEAFIAWGPGIYPAGGLSMTLASTGQFPPAMGGSIGRAPVGILVMVAATLVLALGFNLDAIASIGSAIALLMFSGVTLGHLRIRRETGAHPFILVVGVLATTIALVVFATTTLAEEPAAVTALVVIVAMSVGLDLRWKAVRGRRPEVADRA